MDRRLTRRRALGYGLGAVSSVLVPSLLAACAPRESGNPIATSTNGGAGGPVELPQPEVLTSANGQLDVILHAVTATVDMGAAQPVTTYTFDRIVPGKTWEVRPGDTLKVELVNELPPIEEQHSDDPLAAHRPHAWTTTNLHTHGLHVSSEGNGDNIFLSALAIVMWHVLVRGKDGPTAPAPRHWSAAR